MKLDPAGVEKAEQALFAEYMKAGTINGLATAALTAYFDHLKAEGLMERLGEIADDPSRFSVGPLWTLADDDCPSNAFIIRTDKD